jgi:tetratricopeptide (TPR) repeat protein
MSLKNNVFYILLIAIVTSGCASNPPPAIDSVQDMHQSLLTSKKIPIKAGMYLSDDVKQYIYTQQKAAMPFKMRVGDYLIPTAMTLGATLFNNVTFVDSLPPYDDSYKPDVEAVIKPEILSYYGNFVGSLSGYVEAKIKLRITIYDLGGNILWQDEALGENKSNDVDFFAAAEELDQVGRQAVASAATRIISDFYAASPQELFSLLEIKDAENLRNQGTLPDSELFKKLYEMGQTQYDKKNYFQSLNLFAKASGITPDDPAALFYTGASYTYTGDKQKALERFTDVIEKKSSGQEALNSKKWIQRLDDPLKIGIIDSNKSNSSALNNAAIQDAAMESGMYKVIDNAELASPVPPVTSPDFYKFLNEYDQKGVKIIVLYDVDSSSEKNQSNYYNDEDVTTEHTVRISAKVYSTKKKQLKTEIQVAEKSSAIQEQTMEEDTKTKQQLLQSAAKKLVLQLLNNDIF